MKMSIAATNRVNFDAGNLKGITVGYHPRTEEEMHRFVGSKDMIAAGFTPSNVYAVINGKRQTYKDLKWKRITI